MRRTQVPFVWFCLATLGAGCASDALDVTQPEDVANAQVEDTVGDGRTDELDVEDEPADADDDAARPDEVSADVDVPQSQSEPSFVTVFSRNADGYHTYRIPALLKTQSGVLLAFAEGRVDGFFDKSMNDIVLRRSLDSGQTWLPLQVLHDVGEASLNDPTPVQILTGPNSGRILLMYEQIPCRSSSIEECTELEGFTRINFLTYSDDDGATWSEPLDVTAAVTRSAEDSAGVGPGIAIQKTFEPAAGRVLFPFRGSGNANYAVYSDDGGASWTVSEVADASQTQGAGNEVQIAELSDGALVMNMRNTEGTGFRKLSYSDDGGQTWSPITDDDELIDYQVMAALLRFSDARDHDRDRLVFSNPVTTLRSSGTVRMSYDNGETWPVEREIWHRFFSYSSLVRMDCRHLGLLFEEGVGSATIQFSRFSIAWLTDRADEPDCP